MRFTNDQFGQQYKQVIYRTAIFDDSLRKNCCGIETDAHYSTYENVGSWVLFLQTIGLDFMLKRLVLPGNTHVALQARSDLLNCPEYTMFHTFLHTRPHITRRINSPKISSSIIRAQWSCSISMLFRPSMPLDALSPSRDKHRMDLSMHVQSLAFIFRIISSLQHTVTHQSFVVISQNDPP
jgi:hypothetical protein